MHVGKSVTYPQIVESLLKLRNIICCFYQIYESRKKNQKRKQPQSVKPQTLRTQKRLHSTCMKILKNGKRLKKIARS